MDNESAQMNLTVLISVLKQSTKIAYFSASITMIALILFIALALLTDYTAMTLCSLAVFIMGLVEKYFAIRVDFDRALFKALQQDSVIMHSATVNTLEAVLNRLDNALSQFGLIKPAANAQRNLMQRMQGAVFLLKKQLFCSALQTILLLSSLLVTMTN